MRENLVVKQVKLLLDSLGCYHVTFHGSYLTTNGTPDILACDPTGRFVGIECKTPSERLSIVQWRRGLEILAANGRFIIANDGIDSLTPKVVTINDDTNEYDLFDRFPAGSLSETIEIKKA